MTDQVDIPESVLKSLRIYSRVNAFCRRWRDVLFPDQTLVLRYVTAGDMRFTDRKRGETDGEWERRESATLAALERALGSDLDFVDKLAYELECVEFAAGTELAAIAHEGVIGLGIRDLKSRLPRFRALLENPSFRMYRVRINPVTGSFSVSDREIDLGAMRQQIDEILEMILEE